MTTIVLLICIGIAAGMMSGLIGIGGGIIIVPALVFLMGFSQHDAQGTSLGLMLPPIGILAAYNYYKNGNLNITYAAIIAAAFVFGAFFGSKIAISISDVAIKRIFAVIMIFVAVKMLLNK